MTFSFGVTFFAFFYVSRSIPTDWRGILSAFYVKRLCDLLTFSPTYFMPYSLAKDPALYANSKDIVLV